MTGTSCDGIDLVCSEFGSIDPARTRTLWDRALPYDGSLRERVLEIQAGGPVPLQFLMDLDRDLGIWYGRSIVKCLARVKTNQQPHAIANHGQTVAHFPPKAGLGAVGTTLQLGAPAQVAKVTGLTVIHNFRAGDLAAGGQGAPLVPLYHQQLIGPKRRRLGVAVHNVGGISNFSYFGPDGKVLGFDTGPGNFWMDLAAARFSDGTLRMDRDGKIASRGSADPEGVRRVLRLPYFSVHPPKSTGRDAFPFRLLLSATRARDADLVATALEVTVESIARAYERWVIGEGHPLKEIHLCGGGAKNKFFAKRLAERLECHGISIFSVEKTFGIDPSLVEAQAFAYFGFRTLHGQTLSGVWTGARGFGPPAAITPGANWLALLKRIGPL